MTVETIMTQWTELERVNRSKIIKGRKKVLNFVKFQGLFNGTELALKQLPSN